MASMERSDFLVNDVIKDYIFDLHQATRFSRVQSEVDALYGAKFQELCKTYYNDKTPWPSPETIASLVPDPATGKGSDELFLCFYKEMVDRHFFSTGRPSAQDSVVVWNNYCTLFDSLLNEDKVDMIMNEQWAFDLIHEFIYSFQGFSQFRSDPTRPDEDDLEVLRQNPDIWRAYKVEYYLDRFVQMSNVEAILENARATGVPSRDIDLATAPTPSKLMFDLGYFSMFGLSRLECLLGDYHASLSAISCVNILAPGEYYQKVFGCYTNVFYHTGFAYLMMMRFKDAIRTLGHIVCHIHRLNKMGALRNEESAAKKVMERSAALLTIAVALSPGAKVDDVPGIGKDLARLSSLDGNLIADLEQMLEKACPKFVSGAVPDVDNTSASLSFEPVRRQVQLFVKQATQHVGLSNIRSFLKLYTAIEVEKMAKFNGSPVDEFRCELLAAKHLMSQVENESGSPLSGDVKCALDLLFYVNGNVIHVDDGAEKELRHEGFFMDEIIRAEALAAQTKESTVTHRRNLSAAATTSSSNHYED
jgi:translation initiation factor 3 subunit L